MAVVSTGFFDGVHLGHREVIRTLVSSARSKGEEAIVVTFRHHPRAVLQQDARTLRLLSTNEEKTAMLRSLGVDRVEMLDFTREFASMDAGSYIRDVLVGKYGATGLVIGYDNRVGSDMLGADGIAALCGSLGLECRTVCPLTLETDVPLPGCPAGMTGITVSSTKIREALSLGHVELAARMLGYEYSIGGVVVGGKQLGRTLGFPTANMQMYDPLKILPAEGVYFTGVETLGRKFYGMTNVSGVVETNIFGFDEDIYGLDIRIEFKKRLRDMRRFDSLDALKAQLSADRESCRALF